MYSELYPAGRFSRGSRQNGHGSWSVVVGPARAAQPVAGRGAEVGDPALGAYPPDHPRDLPAASRSLRAFRLGAGDAQRILDGRHGLAHSDFGNC
jgi:hypothetical protein